MESAPLLKVEPDGYWSFVATVSTRFVSCAVGSESFSAFGATAMVWVAVSHTEPFGDAKHTV